LGGGAPEGIPLPLGAPRGHTTPAGGASGHTTPAGALRRAATPAGALRRACHSRWLAGVRAWWPSDCPRRLWAGGDPPQRLRLRKWHALLRLGSNPASAGGAPPPLLGVEPRFRLGRTPSSAWARTPASAWGAPPPPLGVEPRFRLGAHPLLCLGSNPASAWVAPPPLLGVERWVRVWCFPFRSVPRWGGWLGGRCR
jgi:hypothetical protein